MCVRGHIIIKPNGFPFQAYFDPIQTIRTQADIDYLFPLPLILPEWLYIGMLWCPQ